MTRLFFPTAVFLTLTCCLSAQDANFYPITGIAANMTDGNPGGNPLTNIIQGPGVGFNSAAPYEAIGGTWYTDAPGGFPSDYISVHPGPEYIWFDLGADVPLSEISFWGYAATNANGMREFNLLFATEAEGGTAVLGDESYGASITLNPAFTAIQNPVPRQSFTFAPLTARYVQVEATSTFFGQPGAGAGGDRLGIGEIAFEVTTATMGPDIRVPTELALTLAADVPTTFTVPVSNAGDADLLISGTSFTGPNMAAFMVTGVTTPIASLSSGTVQIEFNPVGLGGPIAATLHILSNDPDSMDATVMLSGTLPALTPDISVPAEITLASLGTMETVDVEVTNDGQQPLDLGSAGFSGANAASFAVVAQPVSVAVGGTGTIQISFNPAGLPSGAIDASLQIPSNDPDTPVAEIPISGGIPYEFYPILSVTSATAGTDFYPADNLIQGIGVGFTSAWPHNAIGEGAPSAWVTNAPNGGTGDYFSPLPTPSPVMTLDLGADVALAEVSFWGYANTNANGANLFRLRFATGSDGPSGFGNSISYAPEFAPTQPILPRQSFLFDQTVFARYVEWVPLDNFFGINPPGGDRIGAGEVAFQIVPGASGGFVITEIVRNSPTSVTITFTSNVGSSYAVDRSSDLSDWGNELTDNVMGEAGTTTFTDDTLPPGTAAAYYRVRRL